MFEEQETLMAMIRGQRSERNHTGDAMGFNAGLVFDESKRFDHGRHKQALIRAAKGGLVRSFVAFQDQLRTKEQRQPEHREEDARARGS